MDQIVRMSEEDMLWFACEIAWGRAPFKFIPQQQHIHREWRGWREMVGQINRSDPDLVLDFGCGDNLYSHTAGTELLYPQDRIMNLQGVDLVNRNADLSCDYRYLGEFEDGTVDHIAPCHIIAKPGVKRVLYAHEDSVWYNTHKNPSNTKDVEKLEEELVATSYKKYNEYINKNNKI